jgi:hypothetical protein
MNAVHLHLLLNHVAIMGTIFSTLIFVYALFRKNESVKNVGLAGFVLSALVAIPVFLTGEPAEEAVEHLPGVLESLIHDHEEAAELAIWFVEATGALALLGLLFRKMRFFSGPLFSILLVLVSLAASFSIGYTGYIGGQVRHPEVTGVAPGGEVDAVEAAEEEEHEEED